MPLVGEWANSGWAYSSDSDFYTESWDIDIAPSAAFIKVFLGDYYEFGDKSAAEVGLMNMRFRNQQGVDETVTFPSIDNFGHVFTQFHSKMTHVTFGTRVKNAADSVVWTLGFWG
jgi:hypothetical protein